MITCFISIVSFVLSVPIMIEYMWLVLLPLCPPKNLQVTPKTTTMAEWAMARPTLLQHVTSETVICALLPKTTYYVWCLVQAMLIYECNIIFAMM